MEILIESGNGKYMLEKKASNFYRLELGKVLLNTTEYLDFIVKGVTKLTQRTSCTCTKAEINKEGEFFKVYLTYRANNQPKQIRQRLTLTTEKDLVYIDITGEVK